MKRSTILILMNLFLLCAVCGLITYFWVFSQESYNTIERKTLLTTQEYLESGIQDQEQQILTQLRDYAWWNDTYRFANGVYPEYPDDNFNEISTKNLNVQQITILDNRNNTLWSVYSDPDTHQLVRREIQPALFPILIPAGENETRTVLEVMDDVPYLLCSVPILMTDAGGPVAGTIIFGRQINQNFCYSLERSIHHPVTISMQGSGSTPDLLSAYRFPDLVASITNETDNRIGNTFTTLSSDGQYIIRFSIERPKDIAIMGRNLIGESLMALILIAGGYTAITAFILLSALSQYEHDLEELEASRQEIRIHTERKQISDNIKQVLDTFLEFGADTRENIHRLVSLTAEILHADCVTYSQIQNGEEEIIAATSLPPGYTQDHDPVGKITSYFIQTKTPDSCLYLPLARSGFAETDPLVKAGQYQTYHGCRTFSTEEHSESLNVYYKSAYQPGELDQIILNLISNAIAAEESRGNFQTILQRRDRILEAISSAGTVLMRQADSHDLSMIPAIFGERLGVSRVYISIINQEQNSVIADQIPEPWIGTSGDRTLPLISVYPEIDERLFNILSRIRNGEVVAGPIGSFEKKEQEYFSSRGIRSLAI
ncbi:MAG: hypothetical protein LUQ50_05875, partial [Methanospirillum sp.]|uniref:CHASE4 domain-containing protein n=1 Tax=Methanospirillum sp. TaxID=45200 RepID=UPI0023756BBB